MLGLQNVFLRFSLLPFFVYTFLLFISNLFNRCKTDKIAANDNLREKPQSKVKTTSKVSQELTTRMNLGRPGARARQALNLTHSPQAPLLP